MRRQGDASVHPVLRHRRVQEHPQRNEHCRPSHCHQYLLGGWFEKMRLTTPSNELIRMLYFTESDRTWLQASTGYGAGPGSGTNGKILISKIVVLPWTHNFYFSVCYQRIRNGRYEHCLYYGYNSCVVEPTAASEATQAVDKVLRSLFVTSLRNTHSIVQMKKTSSILVCDLKHIESHGNVILLM